ncbi:MAG: hypothetical protein JSV31_02000 [Desulfobacterales bacterium]|nr:MAG: hypothetical protein JSV31_02000 [Desulfobacterales bacterium]
MKSQISYPEEIKIPEGRAKRAKPDKRWTLLFIGNHGRVITLNRFKGFVLLTALGFALTVAAIVLFYYHNQNIIKKNQKLHSSLDMVQKRLKALRHEKDILMARLVLAESRVKESLEERTEKQPQKPPEPLILKKSPEDAGPAEAEVKKKILAVETPTEPKVESEPPKPNLSVDVADFNITPQADTKNLKIQFKVKNTSPNSQRVSGHTMVVLKGDTLQPKKWLAVPQMPLVDGKPTGKQRGHGFAINYFRTMRFTTGVPPSPDQFKTATVYVFTRTGDLLLEKNFPLDISTASAEAPAQPSMDNVLHTPKGSAAQETSPSMDNALRTPKSSAAQETSPSMDNALRTPKGSAAQETSPSVDNALRTPKGSASQETSPSVDNALHTPKGSASQEASPSMDNALRTPNGSASQEASPSMDNALRTPKGSAAQETSPSMDNVLRTLKGSAAQETSRANDNVLRTPKGDTAQENSSIPQTESQLSGSEDPSIFY